MKDQPGKLLNKLFGIAEEINGSNRCGTYLYRWILFSTRWFRVYLHHFVGNDWTLDMHDHPKRFVSIGLWGWYLEETPKSSVRRYSAPWVRTFPAEHIHRITVPSKNCWTAVIVFKSVRDWGFWNQGRFIPWKQYVYGADRHIADSRKDCL